MAFVPNYDHDIFVSYAHVDDAKFPGMSESWVTTFVLRSRAAFSASSIAGSSTSPSWTSRCGSPPSPARPGTAAKEALSFMRLPSATRDPGTLV